MRQSTSGERIRAARLGRGWSQHALGARCGLPASTVSALECGRVHAWPSWRRRIAVALGVAERELFAEDVVEAVR